MLCRSLGLAPLFCLCIGCTSEKTLPNVVMVSGRVTDGGTPLHVEGRNVAIGRVTVGFYPITDDGERIEATSADVDAEGNFEVIDGVKPGKYLITVRQWDPFPTTDRLKGKFDEKKSRIIRDISADEIELIIDVSNPEG